MHLGTDCTDPSSICINYTTADGDTRGQAHVFGGFFAECTANFAGSKVFAILKKLSAMLKYYGSE